MTRPVLEGISPFFIVEALDKSIAFYRDMLDFELSVLSPAEDPFFAIVRRNGVMLMLKAVEAPPAPNSIRDPYARWDAFVSTPEPDALAAEFTERGVTFSEPLKDTEEGLRGFELTDPDGYVLFFGR